MTSERYGPTLDELWQQEERAKAQMRQVRVTFSTGETEIIRTFMDTPEGRQRADKFAQKLLERENVTRVDVARVGPAAPYAGTEGDGEAGHGQRRQVSDGDAVSPAPSPAADPTQTTSACCQPVRSIGPSGITLRHAWTCLHKGEPFRDSLPPYRPDRLARRHAVQTRRTGLDDAISGHPSGTLTAEGHASWHPGENALDCIECAERGD